MACYLPQQRGTAEGRVELTHQLDLRGEPGPSVVTGLLQTEGGEPGQRSVRRAGLCSWLQGRRGAPEADQGDVPGGSVVKNQLSAQGSSIPGRPPCLCAAMTEPGGTQG